MNTLLDSALGRPQFDLVGPTVDDDIRRAIARYGADAVKNAVRRQTKAKRGRRPDKDWSELREVIEAEARDWLAGGDPIAARTNHAIAKEFAESNPGPSAALTLQRIERKLANKPHDRLWFLLVTAENMSRDGYPYTAHIRALKALTETKSHRAWDTVLERAVSVLADYQAKKGNPPPDDLSMKEVEDMARKTLPLSALAKSSVSGKTS
jgi:hypothetical protein